MTGRIFPTAQDCEAAFYEALERTDLEAMMAVWAEDEEIVCVHPGGQRLTGTEKVRESWRQIFSGGAGARVQILQRAVIAGMMVEVHSVHESFTVPGEQRPRPPIIATNVYLRSGAGWRMVVHHASPAPGGAAEIAGDPPTILH